MTSLSRLTACAAVAATALLAGCASTHDATTAEAKPPREYRTGSNIPVKDAPPPQTQEERDRTAEQVRAIQRTGASGKPGG